MTDIPAARPPRPRIVEVAVGLLALAAVAVVAAAASLFGVSGWLSDNIRTSAAKNNKAVPDNLPGYVHQIAVSQLVVAGILAVLLGFIGYMAFQGRSLARWAAIGLYVLSTLTGTLVGLNAILSVAASEPLIFKIPSFVAGVSFLAAVIILNLRPTTEWLNWGRPAPATRGMFAPRGTNQGQGQRAGTRQGERRPAGGLFGRPAARPKTVDVEPVKVETGPSAAGATAAATAAPRPRPAAKTKSTGKGSAKSRRS